MSVKLILGFRSNVGCQRSMLNRLDRAFQAFLARIKRGNTPGFSRLKGRHRRSRSFDSPRPSIPHVNRRDVLIVKGIGTFRFNASDIAGIKQARVVGTPCRINVPLMVETPEPITINERPPLGGEVGIKAQITWSHGCQAPKRHREMRAVKRAPRRLSRAVKGSNRRHQKKRLLAKAHQRVQERERGSVHELTRSLVTQPSTRFFVEELQITTMVKNGSLARSIPEQQGGLSSLCLPTKRSMRVGESDAQAPARRRRAVRGVA